VQDTTQYRIRFGLETKYYRNSTLQEIHPINHLALQKMVNELKLKAYSPNTIRTYTNEFVQLLKILKKHPVDELSPEKLKSYFLYCIDKLKLSENLIHSRTNAIKFYFEQVLHQEKMFFEIPRPKKPSLLPKAISPRDIKKMFSVVENKKHELLLKMCYGMGLRVSELVHIKITDIDSGSMQVVVNQGKGKKDRYVNLPESILEDLRAYYKKYQPKEYLFEGQFGGQYSVRSAQLVFKNTMKKAKINKKVGIHGLRHSYATHLLEAGTDMVFIQKLLGHNNIKTTLVYAKVSNTMLSNVKSPLDSI
jgi:site-specific recombinase XerD